MGQRVPLTWVREQADQILGTSVRPQTTPNQTSGASTEVSHSQQ